MSIRWWLYLGCKSNVAICHPLWIFISTVVIADLTGEVNLSIESVSLKYYPSIKQISSEYWMSMLKILEYSVTVASAQSQKIPHSKSPDLTSKVFYRQIKYNPKLEASNIKCWSGICLDYHTLTNIHAEYWSVKNSDSTWRVRGWMTHCWGSSGSNKLLHPSSEVPSSSHWNPFR